MYQLISALVKPKEKGSRWVSRAIQNDSMMMLFRDYEKVLATLSHSMLPAPVAVDLEQFRPALSASTQTFQGFLQANGDNTLTTEPNIPALLTKHARYANGFQAGYQIQPVHPTMAPDVVLPISGKPWLQLTRANVDEAFYETLYRHCLVNINGFYHLTDTDHQRLMVVDGMKSALKSGLNQIGLYSFKDIGSMTYLPILPEMLYKQNDRQRYADQCHLDLGQDLTNKTIMLVLGGYLHVLDSKIFSRVGDTAINIQFSNIDLVNRYYESKPYLDLSSLPLETTAMNSEQIALEDIYSDAYIQAYLALSQSFVIILDTPEIFAERDPLPISRIDNQYRTHVKPEFPLIVGYGKHAVYWYTKEDGQFGLSTIDAARTRPVSETSQMAQLISVSDQNETVLPKERSDAYFLKIGKDVL